MAGKTLDDLEHLDWGEPTFDSHLVTTCHRLRKKPVDEFTVEDLRIMIGQKISLQHLLPRAIAVLESEPLAAGAFYPGDLLANVIACDEWLQAHPDLLGRVVTVAGRAVTGLGNGDDELSGRFRAFLASSSSRTKGCT